MDRRKVGRENHRGLGAQELSRRNWMIKHFFLKEEEKTQHRRSKIWSQQGMVDDFCREKVMKPLQVRKVDKNSRTKFKLSNKPGLDS